MKMTFLLAVAILFHTEDLVKSIYSIFLKGRTILGIPCALELVNGANCPNSCRVSESAYSMQKWNRISD